MSLGPSGRVRVMAGTIWVVALASLACSEPSPPTEGPWLEDAELVLPGFDSLVVPLAQGIGSILEDDGVLRVRASLTDWRALGDLDGDGVEDAVVVVWSSGGGSGTFMEVAHFRLEPERGETVAHWAWSGSVMLGDRVRVRALAVTDGYVELHVTQHGPDDPMCCPTVETVRGFDVRDGELAERGAGDG